ncbi:hypothetical protein [Actinokineospora globicatena]|uniref:hypothetical protein n=1 Tax=Actinokineospora globicatena TaxID=103729 RepID=UPI0020A40F31|nr:hypothetical protein [Actinokineospora globicatena]MCP2304557.1 hypothetical protein [Actinokineospora globicatena]GLW78074.1 hypothetical protein Aglo01_25560 [Actinokineospora globicatena]GLW85260.1 hypothetical protein Aglo02_29000 [Actinokineospora globicatena]
MTADRRSARSLRRTLLRYSFATACAVALLISVILVMQDDDMTAAQISSSVGLNLFASVVFALMFAALANWVQDRHTQDTIAESLEEFAGRVTADLARTNRMFLPAKHYDALNPTTSFGDDYNRDLTVDLESTVFFAFYGPSARYVAARLLAARHHPQQIRVAMINPGNRRAISRRAADRLSWLRSRGQPIEAIEAELEDELLMNLVSLFDCRKICPVEVLYNDDTAVYRYAMVDQSVYVSWYHSPASARMELPESYRFAKDSFLYSTLRMDLMRKFEISDHKVLFDASHTDTVLIDHLTSLTGRDITPADLVRWRAAQVQDSASFRSYLTSMRDSLDPPTPNAD